MSYLRGDINWLAGEFVKKTNFKRIKCSQPKVVEWPNEVGKSLLRCHDMKGLTEKTCLNLKPSLVA